MRGGAGRSETRKSRGGITMKLWDDMDDSEEEQEEKNNSSGSGLKSLTPDTSGEETQSSGGQRKYVQPSQEEFEEFLDDLEEQLGIEWEIAEDDRAKEIIYEASEVLPSHDARVLRVFSTIDERTGKARSKGSDAIRTVLWDSNINRPIGGRTKTLRIKTWKKNLKKKVVDLINNTSEYITVCDECENFMIIRENSNTGEEFLGCSSYPKCKNTEPLPE